MFNPELIELFGTLDALKQDSLSWWRWRFRSEKVEPWDAFVFSFKRWPEFRTLAFYRLVTIGKMERNLFPNSRLQNNLVISCPDVGGGLRLQHGYSTYILARKIGRNCHVNQCVTIGNADGDDCPIIGDSVAIRTGAVVVGRITIGDNVTIAPNAFVNFDVPANSYVFPARSVIVQKVEHD